MATAENKATITIDRELWKRAKSKAALQDTTLAKLVETALLESLDMDDKFERYTKVRSKPYTK